MTALSALIVALFVALWGCLPTTQSPLTLRSYQDSRLQWQKRCHDCHHASVNWGSKGNLNPFALMVTALLKIVAPEAPIVYRARCAALDASPPLQKMRLTLQTPPWKPFQQDRGAEGVAEVVGELIVVVVPWRPMKTVVVVRAGVVGHCPLVMMSHAGVKASYCLRGTCKERLLAKLKVMCSIHLRVLKNVLFAFLWVPMRNARIHHNHMCGTHKIQHPRDALAHRRCTTTQSQESETVSNHGYPGNLTGQLAHAEKTSFAKGQSVVIRQSKYIPLVLAAIQVVPCSAAASVPASFASSCPAGRC